MILRLFILVALPLIAMSSCDNTGSREELIAFYDDPFTEKYRFLTDTDDRDAIFLSLGKEYKSFVQQVKDNPKSGFAVTYDWGSFVYTYSDGYYRLRHLEIRANIPVFSRSFYFGGSKKAIISRFGKPDRDFGDGLLYGMSKDLMNVVTFSFSEGNLASVSCEYLVTDKR